MKKKYLIALTAFIVLITVVSFSFIFTIPSQPQILTINHQDSASPLVCYENSNAQAIDANGLLELLVWNIYKQNKVTWHSELDKFSQSSQLVLLQEASMTDALKSWITERQWGGEPSRSLSCIG